MSYTAEYAVTLGVLAVLFAILIAVNVLNPPETHDREPWDYEEDRYWEDVINSRPIPHETD